jgi:2,4-dienoyl-CoA reductase (NADPH2)
VEKDGNIEEIPADTVVLAAGAASYNPLQEFVEKQGIPCKVIGDAARVALAFDAVHQGFEAGRAI